jgi:pullulanase
MAVNRWFRILRWTVFLAVHPLTGNTMSDTLKIVYAKLQTPREIEIRLSRPVPSLSLADVSIDGGETLERIEVRGATCLVTASGIDVRRNATVAVRGAGAKTLAPDGVLDHFISSKPMGCTVENGKGVFRIFAPRAAAVTLEWFERYEDTDGHRVDMQRDRDGVWEAAVPGLPYGLYYGYRIAGPPGPGEAFNPMILVADPYSRALATENSYLHRAKTLVPPPSGFDWEGDGWIRRPLDELVIYEMHVRDMTAHPTSGVGSPASGTYLGLAESGRAGGIDYIASLGVNAVELLPVQEFGNIEVDYRNPGLKIYNDWNPYARNHWGYMTSGFFAPESYYASDGGLAPGGSSGLFGRGLDEFKTLVKAFHRRGIAVLMDVVYNHVSEYDQNPFKAIDKKYYFRLGDDQEYRMSSGCGNDFRTERPMARRLIVESLEYWMREFHVDGFRFDLATMLDDRTLDAITERTRKINPEVILIAEPWGGGAYGQEPFSRRGWGAWNDWFRNGVKGQNPSDGLGFVFGKFQGGNTPASLRAFVCGTTLSHGGPFHSASHSVNYLESHDDHTFGDFVRLGTGAVRPGEVIRDPDGNARLTGRQLALHKLGALFLFTSRGAVMIHEGQEFGRSKVIAATDCPDPDVGKIDHNSYNKDNETNWINYRHAEWNRELTDYYRGLAALRARYAALRRHDSPEPEFLDAAGSPVVAFRISGSRRPGAGDLIVVLNGNPESECRFRLPDGKWSVLADGERAGVQPLRAGISGTVILPPSSGMVLVRE